MSLPSLQSLLPDVLMEVVSKLERKDRASLALCCRELAGKAAGGPSALWYRACTPGLLKLRLYDGLPDLMQQWLARGQLLPPSVTRVEIDAPVSAAMMAQWRAIALLVHLAPNLESLRLDGLEIHCPLLNLRELPRLRELDVQLRSVYGSIDLFEAFVNDADSGSVAYSHLCSLSGLKRLAFGCDSGGDWPGPTGALPSGLTALTLTGFSGAHQPIDMALPRGLLELALDDVLDPQLSLEAASQLTSLRMNESQIDLSTAAGSLRSLHVSSSMPLDWTLPELPRLAQLEELVLVDVWEADLYDDDELYSLSALASLTRLTRLSLVTFGPVDCSSLAACAFPRLTSLCLELDPLPDTSYLPLLPAAPCLRSLTLSLTYASIHHPGTIGVHPLPLPLGRPSAPDLSRHPRLSEVVLRSAVLDAEAVQHLCALPPLRSLALRGCEVEDASRRLLARTHPCVAFDDSPQDTGQIGKPDSWIF